jgi:hypothetical protein
MSRHKSDPDGLEKHHWKKASHGSYRNGKPRVQITMPGYLFDAIRKEAADRERSVNAVTVDWLEAAYELSYGDGQ